jgi:hypothetical protein
MHGWTWLAGVAWIGGCAATLQMTAGELAGRAQQNMVVAQRDLAGRHIVVHGTVRGSTLVTTTSKMEAQVTFGYTAEAETVRESIPMAVLEPGSVQCYFQPQHIDDVAGLKQGQEVALDCEVNSFQTKGHHTISVLSECRRAR